jgi:hypothetical protein
MKPFFLVLALLVSSSALLASGVNAALEQVSRSCSQNSFTVFNEQGAIVSTYDGDLAFCQAFVKPSPVVTPTFLHRT